MYYPVKRFKIQEGKIIEVYHAGDIIIAKKTKQVFKVVSQPTYLDCSKCAIGNHPSQKQFKSCAHVLSFVLDIPVIQGGCNAILPNGYMFEELKEGV